MRFFRFRKRPAAALGWMGGDEALPVRSGTARFLQRPNSVVARTGTVHVEPRRWNVFPVSSFCRFLIHGVLLHGVLLHGVLLSPTIRGILSSPPFAALEAGVASGPT